MSVVFSCKLGKAIVPQQKSSDFVVYDLARGCYSDNESEHRYLYSVNDWAEALHPNTSDALNFACKQFWSERAACHLRTLIQIDDLELTHQVLMHVEDKIEEHAIATQITDALLVAPLKPDQIFKNLSAQALGQGLGSTAAILDTVTELQPLLRRLTEIWIEYSLSLDSEYQYNKSIFWNILTRSVGVSKLLESKNQNDFRHIWNLSIFYIKSRSDRITLTAAGREISCKLYSNFQTYDVLELRDSSEAAGAVELGPSSHTAFVRTGKQIDEILRLVERGQDRKAKKFIKRLKAEQLASSESKEYSLKSLCNLAQKCAEMFRADFESFCLEEALSITKDDSWTLIQYGNHLKRIGNYAGALAAIRKSYVMEPSHIAKTSEADVYTQQAKFEEALEIYTSIEDWDSDYIVRTAIGDTYRKKNDFYNALSIYNQLTVELDQSDNPSERDTYSRANIGIAEIYKKKGEYDKAIEIYQQVIGLPGLTKSTVTVYQLGLCNLLKLTGKYTEAFDISDQVIQENPFYVEARYIRASILGLLGQEKQGLKDLPDTPPKSWKEWIRPYYRGILLLRLKRYSEARKALILSLKDPTISHEDKFIVRVASALSIINSRDIREVEKLLDTKIDFQGCHNRHLVAVLKLHVASRKNEKRKFHKLRKALRAMSIKDNSINAAIVAISKRRYIDALKHETEAFLKIAA